MSKHATYRHQILVYLVSWHVVIIFLVIIANFFGGFDSEEFFQLIGFLGFAAAFYQGLDFCFYRTLCWFLPKVFSTNKTEINLVMYGMVIVIASKCLFNWLNFEQMMFAVKTSQTILVILCCRRKKPSQYF